MAVLTVPPVSAYGKNVPERSALQRYLALERANEVRSFRARVKRDLKARRVDPVVLVLSPPEEMATMKVWDLLLATPKVARVKANACLRRCGISPSKTLGGLSARQRGELVSWLRGLVGDTGARVGAA